MQTETDSHFTKAKSFGPSEGKKNFYKRPSREKFLSNKNWLGLIEGSETKLKLQTNLQIKCRLTLRVTLLQCPLFCYKYLRMYVRTYVTRHISKHVEHEKEPKWTCQNHALLKSLICFYFWWDILQLRNKETSFCLRWMSVQIMIETWLYYSSKCA